MLCAAIAESSFSAVEERLRACEFHADIVEIRMDVLSQQVSSSALTKLLEQSSVPVIFTCRKYDEGGAFQGDEAVRLECLRQAVDSGADFIDVELSSDAAMRARLIKHARNAGCKVIVSWHNFHETPAGDKLEDILVQQKHAGADVAKIVTTARTGMDIPRLFSLYYAAAELGIPLIAFCMGEAGRISRVACLAMGAYLSFASADTGLETAPGQIPLEQFRKIVDVVL